MSTTDDTLDPTTSLIVKEEHILGKVKLKYYLAYVKAAGIVVVVGMLLSLILTAVMQCHVRNCIHAITDIYQY